MMIQIVMMMVIVIWILRKCSDIDNDSGHDNNSAFDIDIDNFKGSVSDIDSDNNIDSDTF